MAAGQRDPGNAGEVRLARQGRQRGNAARVVAFLDPVAAARTRIALIVRYGGTPDPADVAIVAAAEGASSPAP